MGAKTRTAVAVALVGKIMLVGLAIAAPMALPPPSEPARIDTRVQTDEPLSFASHERVSPMPVATPAPVPLPTSLALIGSSLLVLALVGATL